MDQALVPDTPESKSELAATQLANQEVNSGEVTHNDIQQDIKGNIVKIEKLLLKILSVVLIIHGMIALYDEMLEIFFVFPHIPELIHDSNFSETAYQTIYKRTILISATAAIESIYGLAMLARLKHLAHRLHLFSGLTLLIISLVVANQVVSLETLDTQHRIPHIPSSRSLINPPEGVNRFELFTGLLQSHSSSFEGTEVNNPSESTDH